VAPVPLDLDLPPGLTVTGSPRHGHGHGLEISWPLPARCRCDRGAHEDTTSLEFTNRVQVVRDLDLWGQPSFWIYPPAYHRCPWCNHRQWLIPPFQGKDTRSTYRFEQQVLRLMIGSKEEEGARRRGVSAERGDRIVRHPLADAKDKEVDPQRLLRDVGLDERSLKKRHHLYATILTDLTNAQQPEVLAVAQGKDEPAARQCLDKLAPSQRQGVQTYRADRAVAFHNVCRELLPKAKPVVDRFPVAQKFNAAIDGQRKKTRTANLG